MEHRANEIKDCKYVKRYREKGGEELDDTYFFLDKDLIVYFNKNAAEAILIYGITDPTYVNELSKELRKFKTRSYYGKPEILLLTQSMKGLEATPLEITKPKLSIEDNYNDDFQSIHQTIIQRLKKKNDKGLVLLHGKPGTGKTSYIRYLIASVRKDVIFLPPNLAAAITDPSLVNTLINNPNSIFVIEDAENIITDRNQNGTSAVSALLNLADGLLSDCLNIQIICTFNTDISKIDSALLRKGRLIAKYEFNELTKEKSQKLSDKLGFKTTIDKSMTLAHIYNQNNPDFELETGHKRIGFNS